MKGRSHRPSSSEPDDWGDGSWTVDCVCGVNFDDGEEMVNCDECGVWVHTRCSRFVKGEPSFACDKCKSKKKRKEESEETEVAQLLAELPTKTLRMDSFPAPSFRTAAEIPMEERVHVQGIPGGDPALFDGLSTIFSRELWKCTGYVPKKLNFQYREFPCWEDKENIDLVPFLQSKMQIGRPVGDGLKGSGDPEKVSEGRVNEDVAADNCVATDIPTTSKEKTGVHHGSDSRREEKHPSPNFPQDEPITLDVKSSSCSNYNAAREKLIGEGWKLQLHKADEPSTCSEPKQPAVSGNAILKQASQQSAPGGKSPRPTIFDDNLQLHKQQPFVPKQLQDHCQVVKDADDFHGQSGQSIQSRESVVGTELKCVLDAPKQISAEAVQYQDDGPSEERQLKSDQSCQGVHEQVRGSPQQSSSSQQEGRLQAMHRPRFTMGSSIYTASAIALSLQMPSSKTQPGNLKSSPGSTHVQKSAVAGAGRTSLSNSVSRSPISGSSAGGSSKSSSAGMKSSVIPVSSSSTTKQIHVSKQRFRAGNATDLKKDDVGSAIHKGPNMESPAHVSPEISSFKTVMRDSVKCSTNSAVKTASCGNSSFQAGTSKQAISTLKGHTYCSSSKSFPGQSFPLCSGSAEPATTAQPQHALSMQTKQVTIVTTHKIEKSNLPTTQSASKAATTLTPSLIDEILSKNHLKSYEELCDAVLPHWQNLRKHNGERYAYTSHCQAVLDCLRNRSAWAHLVDRGPKTGMGRKRRRIDAASALDSENDEDPEGRGSIHEDERHTGRLSKLHDVGSEGNDSLASDRQKNIDITHLEDVPKGKRKARRRRPLAVKGRQDMDEFKRLKREDKQRHKVEGLAKTTRQDEHEPFSLSSEDTASNSSEDDNHNSAQTARMQLASSDISADELESSP